MLQYPEYPLSIHLVFYQSSVQLSSVATNQSSMVNRRNHRADISHLSEYGHLPRSQKATDNFCSYSDATKSTLWVATATLARKRAIRATDCTGVFLQRLDTGSTNLYVRAFGKAT